MPPEHVCFLVDFVRISCGRIYLSLCRFDAVASQRHVSQSVDVSPAVADCVSVGNMSHTKHCIIHTDLSSDVASVCGVLLPTVHGPLTSAKVYNK